MPAPWHEGQYVQYVIAQAEVREMQRDLAQRKRSTAAPRKPAHRRPARLPPLGAKDGPLSTSRSEPATRVRRMAGDNRCRWNAQHCELLADLIAEPPPREARPLIAFPVLPRHHEEPPKAKSPFLSPCREHVRRGTFVWDAGLRGV